MAKQLNDILNRWSASVRVDGEDAEIFKVEHAVKKTTCFIEAVEGKEFEVTVHGTKDIGTDQVFWLAVDGVRIDGCSIRRFLYHDRWTCKGKQVSQSTLRPFVFTPIALTDDVNAAIKNEDVLKGLGTIRLDFYRTVYQGQVANTVSYADDTADHVVDEKCKKATMSHTTSFGAPKTTTASQYTAQTEYIDPFGSPQYSLVFQYRSRDLLEADGIIEDTSVPLCTDCIDRRSELGCRRQSCSGGPRIDSSRPASDHHARRFRLRPTYKDVTKGPLVDEKTKKARMSHTTGFGEARFAPARGSSVNVDWTDSADRPCYSLIFKYRSKTLLELEGILEGDAHEEEPVPAVRNAGTSVSASPSVEPGARSSSATGGKKNKKRKKIELTLADSSDEEDGADLRAKVARLEAENAKLRNAVKADPDGVRVKPEPGVKEEYKVKVTTENGKVVLDLLDD